MALRGQPLIKRALRHQMRTHQTSLQERPLGINPTQHDSLRGSGERPPNSSTPRSRSRASSDDFLLTHLVAEIVTRAHCKPYEVYETLWALLGEGLIFLNPDGQGSGTDNWRWQLSAVGTKAATSGTWEPHDPERYMERLRAYSPSITPVAISYVEEALRAFNARCYLASAVILGVASECVMEGLARAVSDATPGAQQLRRAIANPRTSQFTRFVELRKQLEPMRNALPDGLADTLPLDAVADLLRVTRNEAGHSTGNQMDEDTAYTHLQMAARYLQKMTTLEAYFREKSASSPDCGP